MKVRVYIAGPMTGYENFNREAFNRAELALAEKLGHVVIFQEREEGEQNG